MQRVNYDQIAHLYDEPARDHQVDANLIAYFETLSENAQSDFTVLDVGCGTGKQLHANRNQFPEIQMLGIDLFGGMLREAHHRNPAINWTQGDGAKLPLPSNCINYATNQFSYPHIQQKEQMVAEVYRVLKPGGQFVMTNIDPWSMPNWILYHYFPEAQAMDHQDFIPVPEFQALMQQIGYQNIQVEHQRRATKEPIKAFLEFAQQRYRTSHFIALSDRDYETGLNRVAQDVSDYGDTFSRDSESCVVRIKGIKDL